MGITIHYYTRRGNHLDPAHASEQYARAVTIVSELADRHGWESLGTSRKPNHRFAEKLAEGDARSTADGLGNLVVTAWNPDPGCETFALEWVEGSGILPYCFVKTQYSEQRVLVHAQLCDMLLRVNREAFDGKLCIYDEGDYLPDRSLDRLGAAFGESDAAIASVLGLLRAKGWDVRSPIEQPDTDTHTDPSQSSSS